MIVCYPLFSADIPQTDLEKKRKDQLTLRQDEPLTGEKILTRK